MRKNGIFKIIYSVILCFLLISCGNSKVENTVISENDYITQLVNDMTLEEKVGQLLLVRCPENNQTELMKKFKFGGYILYEKDFVENGDYLQKENIINKINSYKEVSKITPFIAVDEEGGVVTRITRNTDIFLEEESLSPKEIYITDGIEKLYDITNSKNKKLVQLGINLNLAPVADISNIGTFMYERSLSSDALETSNAIKSMITAMNDANIGSCLKHFPGYGDCMDSHGGLKAEDNRSLSDFKEKDFLPFEYGINEGADSIMMSHIYNFNLDNKLPASLSENMHNILRDDLNFNGVIITDDLWMISRSEYNINENLAPLAIKAGNDMIISTGYEKDYFDILNAVKRREISEQRITESVIRIINWKYKLGIIQ